MRYLAYAASFVVLAAAGCGSDSEATWGGPPDPAADGTVAVEAFNAYAADVDDAWEGSAAMSAAEFLRLDERSVTRTTIEAEASGEGSGPETVVVTLDGLLDDSVRAERWTLRFVPDGDDYELAHAEWAQRCQPERGHQDFSPELCV